MRHDLGKSEVFGDRRKSRGGGLADEKIFLDHLGTRFWSRNTRLERPQMLQNYIDTIKFRREPWAPVAGMYAERLLREEMKGVR